MKIKNVCLSFLLATLCGCNLPSVKNDSYQQQRDQQQRDLAAQRESRGSVAEYDEGPPLNSEWPDIFAETPDYRAFGKAIYESAFKKSGLRPDNSEKFRWVVGPMWYRGRLAPESVKIFIVGQEGAQDENTSNRTFTGSTGTKMQNFINYFGIDRSYLFMNTFIYTITGQYGEKPKPGDSADSIKKSKVQSEALYWLAQDPNSAIVKHRHRMFDYMLSQNKKTLSLIIGVGSAGKDSVATWIRSHGGKCTSAQLSNSSCDAGSIAPGVMAIGVKHPGAASARNGGSDAASSLKVEFAKKAALVAGWIQKNPNWLKSDEGMKTDFSKSYFYADAVIPHRDFAFGSIWRLGEDGTTSNRKGADGIQVYSSHGCYNNTKRNQPRSNGQMACYQPIANPKSSADIQKNRENTEDLKYFEPQDIGQRPQMATEDLPYESPKSKEGRRQYDQGPGADFAAVLMGQAGNPWPDFNSLGVTQHASFGYGPIYRGNLNKAVVLVLADQESHDDMFSTRALTGTGGQKFQTFLAALGAQGQYAIIRTLPVDTLDLSLEKVKSIALNPDVMRTRKQILDTVIKKGNTKIILTIGSVAAEAIRAYQPSFPVLNLDSANDDSHVEQWNAALKKIQSLNIGFRVGSYSGNLTAIPRQDLPVHTRVWMGTSGSRATRAYLMNGSSRAWHPDYYKFDAPTWVNVKNYPAYSNSLKGDALDSLNIFNKVDLKDIESNNGASADDSDENEDGRGSSSEQR